MPSTWMLRLLILNAQHIRSNNNPTLWLNKLGISSCQAALQVGIPIILQPSSDPKMPKRDVVPSPIVDQLFFTHSPLFPRHSSPNCTHSYTLHVQYKPPIVPTQTANSGIKNHVFEALLLWQCPKEKWIKRKTPAQWTTVRSHPAQ